MKGAGGLVAAAVLVLSAHDAAMAQSASELIYNGCGSQTGNRTAIFSHGGFEIYPGVLSETSLCSAAEDPKGGNGTYCTWIEYIAGDGDTCMLAKPHPKPGSSWDFTVAPAVNDAPGQQSVTHELAIQGPAGTPEYVVISSNGAFRISETPSH